MYLLEELDQQIADVQRRMERFNRVRSWIEENQQKFAELPNATICGSYIDFDRLAHDQVMKVVLTFGGKWRRSPNGERLDYSCNVNEDITLRCYQGQPPPNCHIEYEEVKIPARTERRPKFVCNSTANALTDAVPKLEMESPQEIPF